MPVGVVADGLEAGLDVAHPDKRVGLSPQHRQVLPQSALNGFPIGPGKLGADLVERVGQCDRELGDAHQSRTHVARPARYSRWRRTS
jgi:hypothetical protein